MPAGVHRVGPSAEHELDEFEQWIAEEEQHDSRLSGAVQDSACRSGLIRHLISVRHALGISQARVAELMETTQSAVSELESGGSDPRLSTLQRYGRAVDCALHIHVAPAWQGNFVVVDSTVHALTRQLNLPPGSGFQAATWIAGALPAAGAVDTDEPAAAF